jgi:hypothetical protein
MADPRATPDSLETTRSPGVLGHWSPVDAAQSRQPRHACTQGAIRVSAIAFRHNPDTSDALFKASVLAREGVWHEEHWAAEGEIYVRFAPR